ncbi:ligand-binding sensor domain-containing diguanylate cyclase [Aliikangiella coralliicola]|uniref:Diguanylate cyclase n=1 Tax=Aliikangiella coralliicola TaxID=2592383 RepID=A0A545UFS0_9GAMM|nr:ligand-binding sensor domain-containing diguanylate cyclase [Aliikangiella coralliicola]TQV88319.1 diguanylate cyclase [Aliikangiella coralliicola]
MSPTLQSQPNSLPFLRLGDNQGLPSNIVITIMQDSYGYIWFGTGAGLSRFNGYQFTNFQHDPQNPNSLLANKIWALYEDEKGILWIGTEFGGLNRYDPSTGLFSAYIHDPENQHSISHNYVREIHPAPNGKLWIGTSGGGLNLFDPQTGQFKHYKHDASNPNSLSGNYIRALKTDAKGGLWIGLSSSGLNYLSADGKHFKHYRHLPGGTNQISSDMVQNILLTSENELYVGTWKAGLNRLNISSGKWTHIKSQNDESSVFHQTAIVSLIQSNTGEIWAGTAASGLYQFDPQTDALSLYQNNSSDIQSPPSGSIFALAQDRQGLIWLGSWGNGAAVANPKAAQIVRYRHIPGQPSSLANGIVGGAVIDYKQTLWVGVEGGALNALEKNTEQFVRLKHNPENPQSIGDNDVVVVYQDPVEKEILWLGTRFGGVTRFNLDTNEFRHYQHHVDSPNSLSDNHVVSIYRDRKNILWVGTTNGLNRINLTDNSITQFRENAAIEGALKNEWIGVIFEDSQDNLWFGSGAGLVRLDPSTMKFISYQHDINNPNSISHNLVWDIIEDKQNHLWISTEQGINRFRNTAASPAEARFERFGNQQFVSMLLDGTNKIWLSAQQGIFQFDPVSAQFKLFDVSDGALGRNYYPSKLKDENGNFYFGGYDGLIQFNPLTLSRINTQPEVLFSELVLYNRVVSTEDETSILNQRIEDTALISIPYSESVFSLRYSTLDYSLMDKVFYRYKLHGFDSRWTETNLNSLTYTNLDPGNYQLEIQAMDKDGNWSKESTKLDINIARPPWKSYWAYAFYLLSIFAVIRYYLNSQKRRLAYEALKRMSLTDQLTGLKNRYFVDRHIQSDVESCLRKYQNQSLEGEHQFIKNSDLVFFLIDIDHFKQVNDQYGHSAGDLVLKQMRKRLENVFRKSDYLVRWGGEEFLVIARNTSREKAAIIAERFRQVVAMQNFMISDKKSLPLTCSLGFVPFPLIPSSPSLISWTKTLDLADHCLYAAKRAKRNAWVGITEFKSADSADLSFSLLRHHTAQLIENRTLKIVTSVPDNELIIWD